MAEDLHAYYQRKENEKAQAAAIAPTAPATQNVGFTPTGFGADSIFANTPSGSEDKGTLTKFGQTGTGAVKTMMVGEPIKTEPLP
jgi:hypothetical protein